METYIEDGELVSVPAGRLRAGMTFVYDGAVWLRGMLGVSVRMCDGYIDHHSTQLVTPVEPRETPCFIPLRNKVG